jgi:hypothetical protein
MALGRDVSRSRWGRAKLASLLPADALEAAAAAEGGKVLGLLGAAGGEAIKSAPTGVKTAPTGLPSQPPGLDRARLEELVMQHLGKGKAPCSTRLTDPKTHPMFETTRRAHVSLSPRHSFITLPLLVSLVKCHHMTGQSSYIWDCGRAQCSELATPFATSSTLVF